MPQRAADRPVARDLDAEALLPELGAFDLIFADAPAGKWTGLDRTLAALAMRRFEASWGGKIFA